MSPEFSRESIQPVSPEGLNQLKREMMPPEVFEVFNRLLGEKAINGYASLYQAEVVEGLIESGLERNDIFRKGWLNIESLYEENGWEVSYSKPGYNESGYPLFTFRAVKS